MKTVYLKKTVSSMKHNFLAMRLEIWQYIDKRDSRQRRKIMKDLKLCMMGFGNAGKEFAKLLMMKQEEIARIYEINVIVTAIATGTKGNLLKEKGINLQEALAQLETEGGDFRENFAATSLEGVHFIEESGADVLLELSPLSPMDGKPAIDYVLKAMDLGMDVISANKGPIAHGYKMIKEIAYRKGLYFLFEATVMDGAPIFNLVQYGLPGCNIIGVKGILNTTTNFILESMETGMDYEEAVLEAQKRGFAETDPSMDVDGWDSAVKLTTLMNVLMKLDLRPADIHRKGIREITNEDIAVATRENKKIKLICEAGITEGKSWGYVRPTLVDKCDVYGIIDTTSSILTVSTDLMGDISIIEHKPEIEQTAYGLYSDLLTLIKKKEDLI